jgi:hypothetical protein
MRYDCVAEFIHLLSENIYLQAIGDENAGRKQLAGMLRENAETLNKAANEMAKIWELCEPHMEKSV